MEFILFNNTYFYLIFFVVSGILLFVTAKTSQAGLSTAQAVTLNNHESAVFIDVRPYEKFQEGTISQARHCAPENLNDTSNLPKNKPLILVSQDGRNIQKTAAKFKKAGYEDVRWLNGGISAWQKENLPIKKPSNKNTNKVKIKSKK